MSLALVLATDVTTGERVIFDRTRGAGLVDAVAASCAVPAVWPPVTIGERQFMDGGVGSSANVDAVADCETVVMLAPTAEPGLSPFGHSLADELAQHRSGPALGVFADDASIAAFGRNPLDPDCRAPAALAGRAQGRREAAGLTAFWRRADGYRRSRRRKHSSPTAIITASMVSSQSTGAALSDLSGMCWVWVNGTTSTNQCE
jgi:NTE family protein